MLMNPDKDAELNRILAGPYYIEGGEADEETGPSPELLGAVKTPTVDTVSTQGMALREGREGVTQFGEGSCLQGPSLGFSHSP